MKFKIEKLSKRYNETYVLKELSVYLEDAHSLVLIGPSGGGKTTFLRILAGAEIPCEGRVLLNNNDIYSSKKSLIDYRKKIGVVFQSQNLFPHLTALENIILPLTKVHLLSKEESTERAHSLLERFKMLDHINKRPYELSGGQQQRVAICRAASINPDILFLDEPTSALDPEQTVEVLELIEELKEDQIDMVLVTHEMGFAKQVSDHVFFLSGQKILDHGKSCDFFSSDYDKEKEVVDFLSKVLHYD